MLKLAAPSARISIPSIGRPMSAWSLWAAWHSLAWTAKATSTLTGNRSTRRSDGAVLSWLAGLGSEKRGSYLRPSEELSAEAPRKTRHTPDAAFGRVRSCSPFDVHKSWDHSLPHHYLASRSDIGVRVCRAHAHSGRCRFGDRGILPSSRCRPTYAVSARKRERPRTPKPAVRKADSAGRGGADPPPAVAFMRLAEGFGPGRFAPPLTSSRAHGLRARQG